MLFINEPRAFWSATCQNKDMPLARIFASSHFTSFQHLSDSVQQVVSKPHFVLWKWLKRMLRGNKGLICHAVLRTPTQPKKKGARSISRCIKGSYLTFFAPITLMRLSPNDTQPSGTIQVHLPHYTCTWVLCKWTFVGIFLFIFLYFLC